MKRFFTTIDKSYVFGAIPTDAENGMEAGSVQSVHFAHLERSLKKKKKSYDPGGQRDRGCPSPPLLIRKQHLFVQEFGVAIFLPAKTRDAVYRFHRNA